VIFFSTAFFAKSSATNIDKSIFFFLPPLSFIEEAEIYVLFL